MCFKSLRVTAGGGDRLAKTVVGTAMMAACLCQNLCAQKQPSVNIAQFPNIWKRGSFGPA